MSGHTAQGIVRVLWQRMSVGSDQFVWKIEFLSGLYHVDHKLRLECNGPNNTWWWDVHINGYYLLNSKDTTIDVYLPRGHHIEGMIQGAVENNNPWPLLDYLLELNHPKLNTVVMQLMDAMKVEV